MSIILCIGDIVYSFYIASQVYGEFDEFQQGQVNCSSSVYYSSFVSVIIVFNYVFVVIALIALLYLWYNWFFFDGTINFDLMAKINHNINILIVNIV